MTSKQDAADRSWWREVARLVNAILYSWSYREHATFITPANRYFSVDGKVAQTLMRQATEIERLKAALSPAGITISNHHGDAESTEKKKRTLQDREGVA